MHLQKECVYNTKMKHPYPLRKLVKRSSKELVKRSSKELNFYACIYTYSCVYTQTRDSETSASNAQTGQTQLKELNVAETTKSTTISHQSDQNDQKSEVVKPKTTENSNDLIRLVSMYVCVCVNIYIHTYAA
jgi:hypothetical protein